MRTMALVMEPAFGRDGHLVRDLSSRIPRYTRACSGPEVSRLIFALAAGKLPSWQSNSPGSFRITEPCWMQPSFALDGHPPGDLAARVCWLLELVNTRASEQIDWLVGIRVSLLGRRELQVTALICQAAACFSGDSHQYLPSHQGKLSGFPYSYIQRLPFTGIAKNHARTRLSLHG